MLPVRWLLNGFVSCIALTNITHAQTINEALSHAYLAHPQLNAQRADTRSVDENMPIARGSFLPTAAVQGTGGFLQQDILQSNLKLRNFTYPSGATLVVNLNIFNGFRGLNGIDQAKAQIHQSREALRNAELLVLDNAATAYMDVLRDLAILRLREDYVQMLDNQVEITKQRMAGGELTITDVYQANAALAQAKQYRATSHVNLQTSIATFRQQTGLTPRKLVPAAPLDKLLPKTSDEAIHIANVTHPLALAAQYNAEVSALSVKLLEGQLLPTVGLTGEIGQQYNYVGIANERVFQGGVNMQLNVPLYEGGIVYAQVRQAKEKLGEAKLLYDLQINQIHQAVESSWAAWKQAGKFLAAAKEQVINAEAALAGIREEAKFGQRTSWDILNAQLTLVNARIAFVMGQRDRVMSTYNLLAATGQLSAVMLGLNVPLYDASEHYAGVKNQWIGLEPWK